MVLSNIQKRINSNIMKIVPKSREKGTFPSSFCETNITLIPKPHRGSIGSVPDLLDEEQEQRVWI